MVCVQGQDGLCWQHGLPGALGHIVLSRGTDVPRVPLQPACLSLALSLFVLTWPLINQPSL